MLTPMTLNSSEQAAATQFLKRLIIREFREYPLVKDHALGRVNLIFGTNGTGKTSLLEAIEYAYCGRNRRVNSVPQGTSVTAELVGTDEKLISNTTTSASRLRARHSNWYAKAELKTITIEDSFGKFNFLDTDAAVNLSVDNSIQQCGPDVSRLVLGAEAEKLNDRLVRVKNRVQDDLKDLTRDLNSNEQLRNSAQTRLDALSKVTYVSDSLFAELLDVLRNIGWRLIPGHKGEVENLRQALLSSITLVEVLRRSNLDLMRASEDHLQQFRKEMNESLQQAIDLDGRQKSVALQLADTQRKLQTALARVEAISSLLSYAEADFQMLLVQVEKLNQSVNARASKLIGFRSPSQTDFLAQYHHQLIPVAMESVAARLSELRARLQTAQSSLKVFEAAQNGLNLLRQRLLTTAKELLPSMPTPDHCPLCHTVFEQGQLMARMLIDTNSNSAEQLGRLQNEIVNAEAQITTLEVAESTLRSMQHFLGDIMNPTLVSEAIAMVAADWVALDVERTELVTAQERLAQCETNGLTANDLAENLMVAGVIALPSAADLKILRTEASKTLLDIQNERQRLAVVLADTQQEVQVLATRFSLNLSSEANDIGKEIRAQLTNCDMSIEAKQALSHVLDLGTSTSLDVLAVNLAAARDLLVRIVTAESQETAGSAAFVKESKSIQDLVASMEDQSIVSGRLSEANDTLDGLMKQSSEDVLVQRVLTENAAEIGRTFASIHLPNEFDVKAESDRLQIIRRQSSTEVELNQMSTGQRAAFALSLFLAMNLRLKYGPQVLLFDDPVAHVDDINVLSFLDYLRELAIKGSRQIFFATADSKLAGLFRHKFWFLGEEFREIQLVRE